MLPGILRATQTFCAWQRSITLQKQPESKKKTACIFTTVMWKSSFNIQLKYTIKLTDTLGYECLQCDIIPQRVQINLNPSPRIK